MSKEVIYEHVDYNEYLQRALHAKPKAGAKCARHNGRHTRDVLDAGFYGTTTWNEAVQLVETGWAEGRELVGKILTDIETNEREIERPQVQWDVEGDFVDIGAYVTGQPENMLRFEPTSAQKVARILVSLSASASVTCETLRWRGAAALALIDRLEDSGTRCEVDVGFCNTAENIWLCTANVKRADEPLHPERLAFHLAHPASLRRIKWSFCEASDPVQANMHSFYSEGHYGMPVTEIGKYLPESEKYDLVVPGMQLTSIKQAIAEIEKMFNIVCPTSQPVETDYVPDGNDD